LGFSSYDALFPFLFKSFNQFVINTSRSGGTLWWLALFFFLENFVVFTLEVFLPLGFNDGSTLLYWLRRRSDNP
jgi:hypothetical protein